MWEFNITIRSFADVHEFVSLATVQPFQVLVGNGNRSVNGKSFIGMFSLDYRKPLTVCVTCSEEQFNMFRSAAARFT